MRNLSLQLSTFLLSSAAPLSSSNGRIPGLQPENAGFDSLREQCRNDECGMMNDEWKRQLGLQISV
jgi:hypothetical protein